MDIEIRYVTRFRYPVPVWDSHNALRARPTTDEHQHVRHAGVAIDPETRVRSFVDRWGTAVDTFGVKDPHEELVVTVEAGVSTAPRPRPSGPTPLSELTRPAFREAHWLFLRPTAHAGRPMEVVTAAEGFAAGAGDVASLVSAVTGGVHDAMTYTPGATHVGADLGTVWSDRAGVCQDYAHLAIAMLRSLGVPTRYVSGYFYADDPRSGAAPADNEILVQTHAWIEAIVPGFGWWGIDPTNALEAGERHVKIGHGRDYDDVTPLRGVYYGETDHHMAAEVRMGIGSLDVGTLPAVEIDQ